MKIILFPLLFYCFALIQSCNAQQTYPLSTPYFEVPTNSYMKDTNNELDKFIGTWATTYENKTITFNLVKNVKKYFNDSIDKYYRDTIEMTFTVKNANGTILQSTIQKINTDGTKYHIINSKTVQNNGKTLSLYYNGTNCGVGWGSIMLTQLSPTQLSWSYSPNGSIFRGDE